MTEEKSMDVQVTSGQIKTGNNNKIYYKRIFQESFEQVPKIEIIFIHDILGMHNENEALARKLVHFSKDNSVSAVLLDLRGHGLSSGTRAHVEDLNEYNEDIKNLVNKLNKSSSVSKRVIWGSGIGSIVALKYFIDSKDDGHIKGCIIDHPHFPQESFFSSLFELASFIVPVKKIRYAKIPTHKGSYHFNHKSVSTNLWQELIEASKDVVADSYYINLPLMVFCENRESSGCEIILKRVAKESVAIFEFGSKHHCMQDIQDILVKEVYSWLDKNIC